MDHPSWCSAPHCQENEHRSVPTNYRTEFGDTEVTVQRCQPRPAGTAHYRVAVVHLELVEHVTLDLTDVDAVMLFSVFGLLREDAER